ncbi:glucosaminidase domain-containing protein [Patulibacter minatonensis]|uniref:glucosaminidase domain-containing protein n=1 Tax=Patulibacter minatonensis TaxID=298163 RepID=UPI000684478D|nr:glucosaminidase domain-containing protein [Patulibacter minatonensis]
MRVRPRPLSSIAVVLLASATAAVSPAAASSGPPAGPAAQASPATPRAARAAPSPVGVVRLKPAGSTIATRRSPVAPAPGSAVKDGDSFVIRCQVNGDEQASTYGTSRLWNQVQLPTGEIAYLPGAATDLSTRTEMVAPYCGWQDATRVGGSQGTCFRRSPVRLLAAPRSRAAFVKRAGPEARRSFRSTGVPASVSVAQGILESDSGKATAGANNYFGIKAQQVDPGTGTFTWGSSAVGCVNVPTFESEGGTDVRIIAAFRLYRTMRGSFADHGRFLRDNPRYATAFRYRRDPKRFAKALQRAGYATDPSYSSKLIALIRQERLTRFDR